MVRNPALLSPSNGRSQGAMDMYAALSAPGAADADGSWRMVCRWQPAEGAGGSGLSLSYRLRVTLEPELEPELGQAVEPEPELAVETEPELAPEWEDKLEPEAEPDPPSGGLPEPQPAPPAPGRPVARARAVVRTGTSPPPAGGAARPRAVARARRPTAALEPS